VGSEPVAGEYGHSSTTGLQSAGNSASTIRRDASGKDARSIPKATSPIIKATGTIKICSTHEPLMCLTSSSTAAPYGRSGRTTRAKQIAINVHPIVSPFDWHCLHIGKVMEAVSVVMTALLDLGYRVFCLVHSSVAVSVVGARHLAHDGGQTGLAVGTSSLVHPFSVLESDPAAGGLKS